MLPPPRPQIDGRAFPAKVLALTWDDGPDAGTVELARYLAGLHVSATFFVVGAWVNGVSAEPGEGEGVFATGYEALPVLEELTRLGHRVANHTRNHVILSEVGGAAAAAQLREGQAGLDRWISNDLRLFRAPGGAWSDAASAALDADPAMRALVGPIRWDIDGKDWESSLYCRSASPAVECEPAAPGKKPRVKVPVVAQRYLAAVGSVGHGIVLFHDRVGHVGSRYALDLARAVVPALLAQGYVMAAPVLRFSRPGSRKAKILDPGPLRGDLNGDGRPDACTRTPAGVTCALAGPSGPLEASLWLPAGEMEAAGMDPETLFLADVSDDGRADLCGRDRGGGAVCALAP